MTGNTEDEINQAEGDASVAEDSDNADRQDSSMDNRDDAVKSSDKAEHLEDKTNENSASKNDSPNNSDGHMGTTTKGEGKVLEVAQSVLDEHGGEKDADDDGSPSTGGNTDTRAKEDAKVSDVAQSVLEERGEEEKGADGNDDDDDDQSTAEKADETTPKKEDDSAKGSSKSPPLKKRAVKTDPGSNSEQEIDDKPKKIPTERSPKSRFKKRAVKVDPESASEQDIDDKPDKSPTQSSPKSRFKKRAAKTDPESASEQEIKPGLGKSPAEPKSPLKKRAVKMHPGRASEQEVDGQLEKSLTESIEIKADDDDRASSENRTKNSEKAAAEDSQRRSRTRKSLPTDTFRPEAYDKKPKRRRLSTTTSIPKVDVARFGRGVPLASIPSVKRSILSYAPDSEEAILARKILLDMRNRTVNEGDQEKILAFDGYLKSIRKGASKDEVALQDENSESKFAAKAYKMQVRQIKALCVYFDIDRGSGKRTHKKDHLVDKLLDFLGAPDPELTATFAQKVLSDTEDEKGGGGGDDIVVKRQELSDESDDDSDMDDEDMDDDDEDDDSDMDDEDDDNSDSDHSEGSPRRQTKKAGASKGKKVKPSVKAKRITKVAKKLVADDPDFWVLREIRKGKMPSDEVLRLWVRAYLGCFDAKNTTLTHIVQTAQDRFGCDMKKEKPRIRMLLLEET